MGSGKESLLHSLIKDKEIINQVLKQVEHNIKLIKTESKSEYIGLAEKNFNRVYHDYTDTGNGFKNWKEEIEKIIR